MSRCVFHDDMTAEERDEARADWADHQRDLDRDAAAERGDTLAEQLARIPKQKP